MLLYLVRHGIAIDRDDPKCPDEAERYLTEEGIKKTREVARGVASLIPCCDLGDEGCLVGDPAIEAHVSSPAELTLGADVSGTNVEFLDDEADVPPPVEIASPAVAGVAASVTELGPVEEHAPEGTTVEMPAVDDPPARS